MNGQRTTPTGNPCLTREQRDRLREQVDEAARQRIITLTELGHFARDIDLDGRRPHGHEPRIRPRGQR